MNDLDPIEIDALAKAMNEVAGEKVFEETKELNQHNVAAPSKINSSPQEKKPAVSYPQFHQLEEQVSNASQLSEHETRSLYDVNLNLEVVLGTTKIKLEDALKLQTGSIVKLDKLAGEPVELLINEKPVARGEVVVIEGNYGIRILEIIEEKV